MEERCFGPIRFIPGDNRGKYPFCHSLYIEGAGVLIDPASDRERLKRLREEKEVIQVWLSHWHEDHFMHLDLFEEVPLLISELDAPRLSDIDSFLDGYGIENEKDRRLWQEIMVSQFHYRPRKPAGFFKPGEQIRFEDLTVEIIPAPGHTPGHTCFFFQEPRVLFLGDYDLTPFGPWYGDRDSSIQDTIVSIERLKKIPANIWLTSHETGIFADDPDDLWDQYLAVIHQREAKLVELLNEPRTMADIVDAWIVYQRPREPLEFYAFAEQAIMQKHLNRLMVNSSIVEEDGLFRRR